MTADVGQAEFWDPTVIPEDWHMYFRCSMADQGKVRGEEGEGRTSLGAAKGARWRELGCLLTGRMQVEVTRLMILVGTEAVEGKNYVDTVKECYDQSVR